MARKGSSRLVHYEVFPVVIPDRHEVSEANELLQNPDGHFRTCLKLKDTAVALQHQCCPFRLIVCNSRYRD